MLAEMKFGTVNLYSVKKGLFMLTYRLFVVVIATWIVEVTCVAIVLHVLD